MTARSILWCGLLAVLMLAGAASAQSAGSIRGVVYDDDFDAPLPLAEVLIVETGERTTATEQGNFAFREVPPGTYTLVFSKRGYVREVRANVVVTSGRLTEADARLGGEFTEMEEFIVEDVRIGGGTEVGLLQLRLDSPSLIDSISSELMSQAGAGDAASALRLVAGASVADGKFAVVRGLPDRYVNSQMNGVRLPTADADKRAVQLDQFPSAAIESIRVSKTFTPDQQGDASGGAVNLVLKGIPDETIFRVSSQLSFNTQARGSDFLTYRGGGVDYWGHPNTNHDIPDDPTMLRTAGVSRGDAPLDSKWSMSFGHSHVFEETGVRVGGLFSYFHERDSSFHDNGVDDSLWVVNPGDPLTPVYEQGNPSGGDFRTQLFDITQGTELVQWGALATIGVDTGDHYVGLTWLYTRTAEDEATLAEDTRGKAYFYPGYDPDDPGSPGFGDPLGAPYLRLETLTYTERTTETLQLNGRHTLPLPDFEAIEDVLTFRAPEIDWVLAGSSARLEEPDKRQFGALWTPGFTIGPFMFPPQWQSYSPAANYTVGNFNRTWKDITEESDQHQVNLKLPFEQWSGDEGYFKFGVFRDEVTREYDQNSYSNFAEGLTTFPGEFDEYWSSVWPSEGHPVTDGPPFVDVDYTGEQLISAWYWMVDLPVTTGLDFIGGIREERTKLSIVNHPEVDASWVNPATQSITALGPGDADVFFEQDDTLPSIGFVLTPWEGVTFRGSYSETVARQTFKELSPIQQQDFLGGPVFIGNPYLRMAALENYDLRFDWAPYQGGLVSASWFHKKVTDPIQYVQRAGNVGFTYTTPLNFPRGELTGWELEVRQQLGRLWKPLNGLSIGANATFIDSEVRLPAEEIAILSGPAIMVPTTTREMTNAPQHLYNLFLTYDIEATGTELGLFYTVQGDTLVAGAGQNSGNYVPDVYATEYGTLNLSVAQRLGEHFKLRFQAKNLTNPKIETVYRSSVTGGDVTRTSYTKGIDYSISLSAEFTF